MQHKFSWKCKSKPENVTKHHLFIYYYLYNITLLKYVKFILSKNVKQSLNNDNLNLIKSNQCDEWVDYLDNKRKRINK